MLKIRSFTFILLVLCGLGSIAQPSLAFDDQFENGRLDTAYLDAGAYRLWPVTNLHARVVNTSGQTPLFAIFDSVGFQLRSYHHMVYRETGSAEWQLFDTAWKSGTQSYYYFQNTQPFQSDTVYLSYWAPYTYSDLESYLLSISGDSVVDIWVAGRSIEGRNLYGFEITDPRYLNCYKQTVVVTARQHPIEHINGYFIEGMANFLLQHDSTAAEMRKKYRFLFYPMCNPDGVVNGSGQNAWGQGLNREWADTTHPGGTPEVDSIKMDIWSRTKGSFEYGIDIHSNAGSNLPYYWWGFTPASGVDSSLLWRAQTYVQQVAALDTSSNQGSSLFQNFIQGNGVSSSKTAGNWFYFSGGAVGLTFEPTTEPMGFQGDNALRVRNYKSAGSSLARGFISLADKTDPMRVDVNTTSGGAMIHITGGIRPYSVYWTFGQGGTSDTTRVIPPGAGFGTVYVQVTDSLGCRYEDSVLVDAFTLADHGLEFYVYPVPTDGPLILDFDKKLGEVSVTMYDLFGRVAFQSKSNELPPIRIAPSLSPGIYVLELQSDSGLGRRLIVVR